MVAHAGVLVLLIALVLFLLWPLGQPEWWPYTHERCRYQVLLRLYLDAFAQGHWYPRWMPEMTGGYGYPLFHFYQPGFFFLAMPFAWATGDVSLAVVIAVFLLFVLGGMGVFLLGRSLAGLGTGIFAAVLFLLTPYHFVNLYVRGDLSELMATLLTPWPLFGLAILDKHLRKGLQSWAGPLVMAIGLACIVISNPATALFFAAILVCFIVVLTAAHPLATRGLLLAEATGAFIAGLALSAFYWAPVLATTSETHLASAMAKPIFRACAHTVEFSQLFSPAWGHGVSAPFSANDGMSFQLGLPHFLLALGGIAVGRRSRWILPVGLLYLLLILLMTPLAKWCWEIPFLAQAQFPWRLLSVIAPIQTVCAMGWAEYRAAVRPSYFTPARCWIAGSAALLAVFFWQPAIRSVESYLSVHPSTVAAVALRCRQTAGFQAPSDDPRSDPWRFLRLICRAPHEREAAQLDFEEISKSALAQARSTSRGCYNCDHGEWIPKHADPRQLPGPRREMLTLSCRGSATSGAGYSLYRIEYALVPNGRSTEVIVNQLYFPGWRVRLDGTEVLREDLEKWVLPDGRIRVFLPSSDACVLEAWYDGPLHWRLRTILVMLIVGAWVVFRFRSGRRRANE